MDFKKENSYISHYDISSLDIRFDMCPSLEYILKFQKWYTIPFLTLFSPLKWWLIPNLHQKIYPKWGLHTKYRIQYHHKMSVTQRHTTVHHTRTNHQKCPHYTHTISRLIHITKHSKHNNFT